MAQDHLIHRQILEFTFPTKKEAMDGQHMISRLYQQELTTLINELFDELVSPDEHLRIDRLEVDLGRISNLALADDFRTSLARKLEDELLKKIRGANFTEHRGGDAAGSNSGPKSEGFTMETATHSDLDLFRMFIKTGQLPWWGEKELVNPPEKLVQKLVNEQPERLVKELERLLQSETYSRRMIYQLPDESLQQLLEILQTQWTASRLEEVFRVHEALVRIHQQTRLVPLSNSNFRVLIWQATFNFGLRQSSSFSSPIFKIISQEQRSIKLSDQVPFRDSPPDLTFSKRSHALQSYLLFVVEELAIQKDSGAESNAKFIAELLDMIKEGASKLGLSRQHPLAEIVENFSDLDSQIADVKQLTPDELREAESTEAHDRQKKNDTNRPTLKIDLEEGVQVENAGLVIIAPFLPRFFENLGLVSKGEFVTDTATRRGALLLQYLITGEEEVPEYELLLNKVLCGLPIDEPLARSLEVSEREQQEMDDLLESVITHWKALKKTSVQALRETFLKREGLLSEEANGWKLLVERQTLDVLLDHLPWGISIIKMPWNEKMVQVEW